MQALDIIATKDKIAVARDSGWTAANPTGATGLNVKPAEATGREDKEPSER